MGGPKCPETFGRARSSLSPATLSTPATTTPDLHTAVYTRSPTIITRSPSEPAPLKMMRLFDNSDWKDYRTGSGETVKLPPQMINMTESTEFAPAARLHFGILDDKVAGDKVTLPY